MNKNCHVIQSQQYIAFMHSRNVRLKRLVHKSIKVQLESEGAQEIAQKTTKQGVQPKSADDVRELEQTEQVEGPSGKSENEVYASVK